MMTSWRTKYDDEYKWYTTWWQVEEKHMMMNTIDTLHDDKCTQKEGRQVRERHMMMIIIDTLQYDKLKNIIWWWT